MDMCHHMILTQTPSILVYQIHNLHGLLLGYTTITSNFGHRNSPTSGASSYHSGIDIGAPEGSNIISVSSGIVSFIGFSGARWLYSYYKE